MATAPSVPYVTEEEYLSTSYEVECEYIDGVLVERHVGERKHSRLQALLTAFLVSKEPQYETLTYTGQRIRVGPKRYRAPDVCVMPAEHRKEKVFSEPALLIIEILSEEDQAPELRRKVSDYVRFGVPNICIVDPYNEVVSTVQN